MMSAPDHSAAATRGASGDTAPAFTPARRHEIGCADAFPAQSAGSHSPPSACSRASLSLLMPPPTDAPKPQHTRAVMTGEQVVAILDETVDWYRTLGVQQQSATQPSDLLILYANRQTADRVVALAFEIARANAELLSSQAELEQARTRPTPTQRRRRRSAAEQLDAQRAQALQTEIAATQRQLAAAESASAARCKRRSRSCKASSIS